MTEQTVQGAWVALPSDEQIRAMQAPPASGVPAASSAVARGYDFGFVAGMSRLLLAHDRLGPLFRQLFRELMFGPGQLDRREREMVAAVAAAAQDCHY
jgi:hypothetical protein